MSISHESLVDALFDRMPLGVAVFDRDARILRLNPQWVEFAEGLAQRPFDEDLVGRTAYELFPETAEWAQDMGERVFRGETVFLERLEMEIRGRTRFWDAAFSPVYEDREIVGIIEIVVDVTDREVSRQELEARVDERTADIARRQEVSDGLHFILDTLNSCCAEEQVLDFIISEAKRLLGSEAIAIYRLHVADGMLTMETQRGLDDEQMAALHIPISGGGHVGSTLVQGIPMVMPDVAPLLESSRDRMPPEMFAQFEAVLGRYGAILAVPISIAGQLYGGLAMYYPEPREFTPADIGLAEALADHLSLALENARLREAAEEDAASAERNRLARELHDAVTQTLFSASLIAEVLPQLWERDPEEGRRRLEQLRNLTRGALAEMRTLLLELRPAALAESSLCDLLRQLAAAGQGRAAIDIEVQADGECELSPEIKIALYRVAQEALNNVVKHANATNVSVAFKRVGAGVSLTVADDGLGFETSESHAERLGLGIMRERAESIGATLCVSSAQGQGTRVEVEWQPHEEESS